MTNSWRVPLFLSLPHGALKPFEIGQHFLFFRLAKDVQSLGNWPSAQVKVNTIKTRHVMIRQLICTRILNSNVIKIF